MPKYDLETYEPVEARLERFWQEHPAGRIETRLLTAPELLEEVVVWSGIWFDLAEEHPRGTGLASERRGESGPNQHCHLEVCETSSIGRALANCGFKAKRDAPRPSREEMAKVERTPAAAPESRGDQAAAAGETCSECHGPAGRHGTRCSRRAEVV